MPPTYSAGGCGPDARSAVLAKSNESPVACPAWAYNNRIIVERFRARMKEWRAVATRHEKTANSFMALLSIKAAFDWLKL